jgi:hypothetical protein
MALITCPECKKEISDTANKCPHCGYIIRLTRKWSPGIAALLSLVLPGAGQMYKGKVLVGLLWFMFVVGGYAILAIPGLVLHLVCIFNAATGKAKDE